MSTRINSESSLFLDESFMIVGDAMKSKFPAKQYSHSIQPTASMTNRNDFEAQCGQVNQSIPTTSYCNNPAGGASSIYKRKFSPSIVNLGKHFPKDFFIPTLHHTKETSILNISDYAPISNKSSSIQVMSGYHSSRY